MPPKKKDEKKKDDKVEDDIAKQEERELVEKELVIGYLKSKLGRYQDHGERLQVDNLKLNEELETQKLNLRDINEFLTNELKARSLTTSALEAKVYELNQLLEEIKKNHESALSKLGANKDREIEKLQGQLAEHERKAKQAQEFLDMRASMEGELNTLKETLAKKVKDYEQKLTDMDRQHIQDREKWKREMAQKIKETKLQMMKLTDNQLEMTTKRTIMENEQMSIELSYQSRQTEKLLAKNKALLDENADLRRQLDLSRQTQEELAKRNNVYQKTIKSLLLKLRDQGSAAEESGCVVAELEQRIADLEMQLKLEQLQCEEQQHQLGRLTSSLADKTAEHSSLNDSFDEMGRYLLKCMEDVRSKIVTVVKEERQGGEGGEADVTIIPGRLEELSYEQRERVLAYLLEKLHVFQTSRQQAMEQAGGQGRQEGGGFTLPPIPAFPRRTFTSTAPMSGGPPGTAISLATGAEGAMAGQHGGGSPLSRSRGGGGMTAMSITAVPGATAGQASGSPPPLQLPPAAGAVAAAEGGPSPNGAQGVGAAAQGPGADVGGGLMSPQPIDVMLSKVMSDVRPWGKRSTDMPLTQARTGTFLKKGATATSKGHNAVGVRSSFPVGQ